MTEVRLNSTREEQLSWFYQVWKGGQELREQGVDIRAITVWALLGTYDWNSLVTPWLGNYESGVFDLRSPQPRETAITKMICDLAAGCNPDHPVLDIPSWWHRPEHLVYPPVSCGLDEKWTEESILSSTSHRPLVIIGARGTLGKAFARLCKVRGIPYHLLTRQEMDIAHPVTVEMVLTELQPWAVINAVGYVRVDDAEREQETICV